MNLYNYAYKEVAPSRSIPEIEQLNKVLINLFEDSFNKASALVKKYEDKRK